MVVTGVYCSCSAFVAADLGVCLLLGLRYWCVTIWTVGAPRIVYTPCLHGPGILPLWRNRGFDLSKIQGWTEGAWDGRFDTLHGDWELNNLQFSGALGWDSRLGMDVQIGIWCI
jgi:hypothetical protein